jgi:2-dehydropantoate 2-reductase
VRVNIIGSGQMGSLYGAAALENGHDVCFVDTANSVVSAVNQNGLIIERPDGREDTYEVRAHRRAPDREADVTLFMVKGWATAAAAELARPGIGSNTCVLTLQNGLGNEEVLAEAFPNARLLIGVSVHTVITLAPGHYRQTGTRETFLGPTDSAKDGDADRVAAVFARPSLPVVVCSQPEVRREQWRKFVLNCASLPSMALTRLETAEANRVPEVMTLMDDVIKETCDLAAAVGVELDWKERAGYQRKLFSTAGGRASMLGDVLASRQTEIESINGAAVRKANALGVSVPLNTALYALVLGLDHSIATEVGA